MTSFLKCSKRMTDFQGSEQKKKEGKKRRWFETYLPHAVYFAQNVASGAVDQFMSVALRRAGMSDGVVSVLQCARPAGALLAQPLVAAYADSGRAHRAVVRACSVAAAVCALLVPIASRTCTALLGALLLAMSVARAPLGPLVDTFALRRLGAARDTIGAVRVWGTVAYNLVGVVLGRRVTTTAHPLFVYTVFGLSTLFFSLPLTLALASDGCDSSEKDKSENKENKDKATTTTTAKGGAWTTLCMVLSSREMAGFLVTVMGAGYCHAVFAQYAPVYLVARGDTSADILSRCALAKLAGEVPVLLLGRVLTARLGARGLVALALGGTAARLAGLLVLRGDALALPAALHGLTFAAFWLVMTAHARALAPPGAEATGQAVVSATYNGAASILCSLACAFVASRSGPRAVFHVALLVDLLAFVAFVFSWRTENKIKNKNSKSNKKSRNMSTSETKKDL